MKNSRTKESGKKKIKELGLLRDHLPLVFSRRGSQLGRRSRILGLIPRLVTKLESAWRSKKKDYKLHVDCTSEAIAFKFCLSGSRNQELQSGVVHTEEEKQHEKARDLFNLDHHSFWVLGDLDFNSLVILIFTKVFNRYFNLLI